MNAQHDKVKNIIDKMRTCMFITKSDEGEIKIRPMATNSYDENGNIWFFTDSHSTKVDEVNSDSEVILSYSIPSDDTFLNIKGHAYEVLDPIKKEQLFNFFSKAWFPDGPNSPNLGLIKFVPTEAEFWDSPDWKVFQLFKMAKAVVSGEEYEESKDEHGKVSL